MFTYLPLTRSYWLVFVTLLFVPQISRAAITLSLNPTSVDLPGANAGSTTVVSDSSASLIASGSGSAAFTTSIAYGTPNVACTTPQNWLTVSPSTGNITVGTNVTITLKGNPTGLQACPYTATVTFTSGSSIAKLTVTFTPQGVDLTAGLKAALSSIAAGLKAQVGTISVNLTVSDGSATSQAIQATTHTDGGNWLLTSADSPLNVTGAGVVTVTVDATNLAGGSTHTATITLGCVNGAPCLPQSIPVSVQVTALVPTLTSITPNSGAMGATVPVTLTGTNLTGATAINVGSGISVGSLNAVSSTQVTASFVISANAGIGSQNISITTTGGTSNTLPFTITTPSVTLSVIPPGVVVKFTPNGNPGPGPTTPLSDSSASLQATGSGTVTLMTSVQYNSYPTKIYSSPPNWITSVSPQNNSSITANSGAAPVVIQASPDGLQAWTYTATITFKAGTSTATLQVSMVVNGADLTAGLVSKFSPVQGGANKAVVVNTITATVTNNVNGGVSQGAQVQTMSTPSTWLSTDAETPGSYTLVSGTGNFNITVNAQNLSPGTYQGSITVGCVGTPCYPQPIPVVIQVTPPPPTLTSISPTAGAAGTTVPVTLTGTNLTGATAINIGAGITVSNFNAASATTVTASLVIPANAPMGAQNVTVTTPSGTSNSVSFTINPPPAPTLSSITPNSGAAGSVVSVTLIGANLAGTTAITAGAGITVGSLNVAGNTQVNATFTIAPNASGGQNVTAVTAAGSSNSLIFTITPPNGPTLNSITPNSGVAGTTVPVTLTGSNLTGATAINIGAGITINNLNASSATTVSANLVIPANAPAVAQNVTVTTPGGTSNSLSFTINSPAPILSSITPNSGAAGSVVPVTLIGANLAGTTAITAGSSITVGSLNVASNTQVNATFTIASNASGSQNVTVVTPAGSSSSLIFTVTPPNGPTLNSITPNSGVAGTTVAVSLAGSNLGGVTAINTNPGISFSGLTMVNSNLVTANLTIAASATAGIYPISVATAAGASNQVTFTVTPPSTQIVSVLPQIAAGGSFVTGFYVLNSGSAAANFSISFHNDNGASLSLPFSNLGSLSVLSDSVPANGLKYYEAGVSSDPNGVSGSGLVTADPTITIQAVFRRQVSNVYYEAAIPTNSGSKQFAIPFDGTTFPANGVPIYTGFAIANLDSANSGNVTCTTMNTQGTVIPNALPPVPLSPNGHWAQYVFPLLVGNRGTIDCSSNTNTGPVAIRALGPDAISTLPIIVASGANSQVTGSVPHVAFGGSFVTDFYVVNNGSASANFSISFHDSNGVSLPLPFSGLGSLSTLSDSVPANGSKFYEAGDSNAPDGAGGSGLVTSDPSITIQTLFRRKVSSVYYEATVPTTAGSLEFVIPFDATTFAGNNAQIYTGFAIANLDGANTATVTCTARNAQGVVIPNAVQVSSLPPYGHYANFIFPALAGLQGTIDCSSNTKLGAVAIRALGSDTISTLPVVTLR